MATAILMPRQGQSVESCVLTRWRVKPGDTVRAGDPVASIETDKATFDVEAPAAGTVLALFFEEGADIPVLTRIGAIGAPGESFGELRPGGAAPAQPTAPAAAPSSAAPRPAAPTPASTATAGGVSPRARHHAERLGIATESLAGSGPGGRVIERDVTAAAAAAPRISPAAREALASGGRTAPAAGSGPGGLVLQGDLRSAATPTAPPAPAGLAADETIPLSGIRKVIAARLRASQEQSVPYTITRTVDATALQTLRRQLKARGADWGLPALTLNDLIAFAVVRALRQHPEANAHFLGDRIVRHARVNLGIAMDTPRGLMVPVIAGADRLTLAGLAEAIRPLAAAAQSGQISPDLLSGGTFTITNLGALGVEIFTPVLNTPEVAILGVGGLTLKPVTDGAGGVKHVEALTLSLTCDHQALDGAPAARFLKTVAERLEHFTLNLLG